jgi:hypothetical protein
VVRPGMPGGGEAAAPPRGHRPQRSPGGESAAGALLFFLSSARSAVRAIAPARPRPLTHQARAQGVGHRVGGSACGRVGRTPSLFVSLRGRRSRRRRGEAGGRLRGRRKFAAPKMSAHRRPPPARHPLNAQAVPLAAQCGGGRAGRARSTGESAGCLRSRARGRSERGQSPGRGRVEKRKNAPPQNSHSPRSCASPHARGRARSTCAPPWG